jgi:hypothetical protein
MLLKGVEHQWFLGQIFLIGEVRRNEESHLPDGIREVWGGRPSCPGRVLAPALNICWLARHYLGTPRSWGLPPWQGSKVMPWSSGVRGTHRAASGAHGGRASTQRTWEGGGQLPQRPWMLTHLSWGFKCRNIRVRRWV